MRVLSIKEKTLRFLTAKNIRIGLVSLFFFWVCFSTATNMLARNLLDAYEKQRSAVIKDRAGEIVRIQPNANGYYAESSEFLPPRFKELLIKKEDRFFYYHIGINPFSIARDIAQRIFSGKLEGSSTLTQQLVKILLGNEGGRTLKNKIIEAAYAVSLERHTAKENILTLYANSAYFGNQAQGIKEASLFYFNLPPESLSDDQILQLLATLNSPSGRYPGTPANKRVASSLAYIFGVTIRDEKTAPKSGDADSLTRRRSKTPFELSSLGVGCQRDCEITIDKNLTESVREILYRNLSLPSFASVDNGAVVILKLPENEVLAIVGSSNPFSFEAGRQINMAAEPRPIGSTAKPFIYLKAFEKGARPYSEVEDREYKYEIGTGFAFYPKNYDGQYRGTVTLHQALSNSLNVPTVKVLEFAGLDIFYSFLRDDLEFKPLQPLENYELGIALGGLEMDLLTLSNYFTIFPNEGVLKPLRIFKEQPNENNFLTPPMVREFSQDRRVAKREFTELINKILSDRETGVEQFGLKSSLNLPYQNYALKTGTSRDFHDSWTIGYTPDFLVGTWVGNSDNSPMERLSGQTGAGKIWHEIMELVMNSPYNKKKSFAFDNVKEFSESGSIEYGLAGDDYNRARLLLQSSDLIINPHANDVFLLEKGTVIPLISKDAVRWFVNGKEIGNNSTFSWHPKDAGKYIIRALDKNGKSEEIPVSVNRE